MPFGKNIRHRAASDVFDPTRRSAPHIPGQGLRNATVTLMDTAGGRRTTVTSSFGAYQFEGLETGRDYLLTVTNKRYRFATRTVNLTENLSDVNLVGLE